jgi:hypothetical protein
MNCNNCENPFEGKHCPNCGQKASVGELNLKALLHEFWHAITHTDKGILKLVKDLLLQPKKVYLGYFSGQRKTYFSPVTFFLISATLLILIGAKIFDYEDYVRAASNPNGFNEFGRLVFHETKFKTLITIPFEIILTWLFFRKRFNLAKNIVFWFYFHGIFFTIQILVSPVYFAFIMQKDILDILTILLGYAILFWHLNIVFGQKKWSSYLKIFLIVNFYHILSSLTSAYMLFGDQIFAQTKTNNLFELILFTYQN